MTRMAARPSYPGYGKARMPKNGTYAAIAGATSVTTGTTAAYTPKSTDKGMWLRVTVNYIDEQRR